MLSLPLARVRQTRTGAIVLAGLALLTIAACESAPPATLENTGQTASAVWTNGDFESGTANALPPAPWSVATFLNPGITVQNPQTVAGLNLAVGGVSRTVTLRSAAGPGTLSDPNLGAATSFRYCRYGLQCAIVNGQGTGNNKNVNTLTQTSTITAADVDLADGLVHVRFTIAPVLQNPGHTAAQQPYYFVQVTNVTTNTILYSDFNLSGAGIPWKTVLGGTANEIDYTDWQLVDVAPGNALLAVGHQVTAQFIAAGCQPGAHYGELYVDGIGATISGITVEGTGPAQANAGTNVTYTLTYRNGAAIAESGVITTFATPANTTFQAITPPVGATCVTPAVGAAGTVTCAFTNPVPAGTRATYTLTVGINAAAVGTIVAGTYDIRSNQEPEPLLGPPIRTRVGCALDSHCGAPQWCNESASQCTAKLANGTTIPTDAPHVAPVLNGLCTAAAGTLVCTSGVCDPDNKCGYADGDGPCAVATGPALCRSTACSTNGLCEPLGGCNVDADCSGGNWCNETAHTCTAKLVNGTAIPTDAPHASPTLNGTCTPAVALLVCASGVCDTDNKCGILNGVGPCTAANGGTICRSGVCDPDLKCGLVNNDGPCTVANGGTVCRSGVCDPDLKCGYKDGDGPCTVGNGGTFCRSTMCSTNGLCEPAGGCNVDADCTGGSWCNETAHMCAAKLGNGTAVPNDPPHASPTLDGTCTAPAAALVCMSGVCDTDNKCGLLNSDGPCTVANEGTICRSAVCDADLKCGYPNGDGPCTLATAATVCRSGSCSSSGVCKAPTGCAVDADCASGNWCSGTTCTPKLANGTPIPTVAGHAPALTGVCSSAAVGTAVCASGVCDPVDNECGFKTGDGTCTGTAQCRSGDCITTGPNSGKCEPCATDATCSGATPACNPSTNQCVACTGTNATACVGATPTCDTTTSTCTGGAGAACKVDPDCSGDNWCNAGACVPRLADGLGCDRATQCISAVCNGNGTCGGVAGGDGGLGLSPDDLSIQGGGCNCTTAPGHDGTRSGLAAAGLFIAGILGGLKRRRRESSGAIAR